MLHARPHRRNKGPERKKIFEAHSSPMNPHPPQVEQGMIILHQLARDDFADRFPITKDKILVIYSAATTEIPDFPRLPQHGFGTKSKYGDWFVYNDWKLCEKFVDEHPVLQMEVMPDPQYPDRTFQVQISTKAVKLSGDLKEGQISSTALANFTVHVVVHVGQGLIFKRIKLSHLQEAFSRNDFMTYKANQAGVRVAGERVKSKGVLTEGYHLNIRPVNGDIFGAIFPAFLRVLVDGTTQYLDYRIFPMPDIEREKSARRAHMNSIVHVDAIQLHRPKPRSARPPPTSASCTCFSDRGR